MLVKAKCNVKDSSGWHKAGEVFRTDSNLGDAVEVLEAPKKAEPKKEEPVKAPVKAETAEPEQETPKPKSSRRKKISE